MTTRAALFLDRDGVINVDYGHVGSVSRWEFIPGIFELARAATVRGMPVIVITNQAGIGRGLYSEEDFHTLTDWMKDQFKNASADITDVYFCPFHPTKGVGKYRKHSVDRKPGPGMLIRAAQDHKIDLSSSVFLGDSETDMLAGRAAGLGRLVLFVPTGSTPETAADVTVSRVIDTIHHLPANPAKSDGIEFP